MTSKSTEHPVFRKMLAIFLAFNLGLFESLSYAQSLRGGSSLIPIPESLGTVEETHIAPLKIAEGGGVNNKTILYIQDAHDSLEAQEHIAKIIHYLVEHYGVKTVFEEGFEGPVPTNRYFGFIKDAAVREKVSYFLMDKLRLGGAEYAHINRKNNFKLIGADSRRLHRDNLQAYETSAENREPVEKDLKVLRKEIEKLANLYFPGELKSWMKLKKRYDEKQIPLLDYLKRTKSFLPVDPPPTDYPHLSLLLTAEQTQDKAALDKIKSVDPRTLFEEIHRLESEVAGIYLRTERDLKIFQYYQSFGLLKKLNRIEMDSEEYEAVRETLHRLDTRAFAHFLARETGQPVFLSKRWEEKIKNAVNFYEIAKARDLALEKALANWAEGTVPETAILVFGGFHKERVKALLKKSGFSYQIISPRITSVSPRHQEYYKKLMSTGRHPFEPPRLIRLAVPALRYMEILAGLDRRLPGAGPRVTRRLAHHFEQPSGADKLALYRGAEDVLHTFWLDAARRLSRRRSGGDGLSDGQAAISGTRRTARAEVRMSSTSAERPFQFTLTKLFFITAVIAVGLGGLRLYVELTASGTTMANFLKLAEVYKTTDDYVERSMAVATFSGSYSSESKYGILGLFGDIYHKAYLDVLRKNLLEGEGQDVKTAIDAVRYAVEYPASLDLLLEYFKTGKDEKGLQWVSFRTQEFFDSHPDKVDLPLFNRLLKDVKATSGKRQVELIRVLGALSGHLISNDPKLGQPIVVDALTTLAQSTTGESQHAALTELHRTVVYQSSFKIAPGTTRLETNASALVLPENVGRETLEKAHALLREHGTFKEYSTPTREIIAPLEPLSPESRNKILQSRTRSEARSAPPPALRRSEEARRIVNQMETRLNEVRGARIFYADPMKLADSQIAEGLYAAEATGRNVRVVISGVDVTHPMGKFFAGLSRSREARPKNLYVETLDLAMSVQKHLAGFPEGDVIFVLSEGSTLTAETLKRLVPDRYRVFVFRHRDAHSGVLGQGLIDIQKASRLKQVWPDRYDLDSQGRFSLTDSAIASSWENLYDSRVVFAQAA